MDRAVIVEHLSVQTLKNVSFSLQPGELVGLIGPVGAGKTTILRTLSGLLSPMSGFVEVLEFNPGEKKPEFLKQIGLVLGQCTQLWPQLSARKTFELNKAIYELPSRQYVENLNELTELLGVIKLVDVPVKRLSFGQRMRLEIVAALLHKPQIVLLDEPISDLDLVAGARVRDFIYAYNRKYGVTTLFATHSLDDLIGLVRRVIVINDGKIIFDGVLEKLLGSYAKEKLIKINLAQDVNVESLNKIGQVRMWTYPQAVVAVPRSTVAVAAAEILQNYPVTDLAIEEIPIEEVVRKAIKQ
jgi:ABC-2 type transport system ATP-binding protein